MLVFIVTIWVRDLRSDASFRRTPPSADERREAYETLLAAFPDPPEAPDAALLLLGEAKRHYEAIVKGAKSVEGRGDGRFYGRSRWN
jgi:hypothetical protein